MRNFVTQDLASHGRVVIMLEHRDGSAQLTRDVHNEIYPYDVRKRTLYHRTQFLFEMYAFVHTLVHMHVYTVLWNRESVSSLL